MAIQCDIQQDNNVVSMLVRGNLDAQSAGGLREQLKAMASEAAGRRIVVDLSKVPFMDSTGLAALISDLKIVRQNQGDMALTGVTPEVMRIFQITLLDRAFTFI